MSVHATIFPGDRGRTIHRDEHGQEVLGPAAAVLTVKASEHPELTPFDETALEVELRDGRYDITDVHIHAGEHGVSARALQQVKLPQIVRLGLQDEVTVRRTTEDGRTVTGVGREDELPLVYLLAWAVGDDPTKAVQEAFGLPSRQAAAQRVARARRAKRLPPAAGKGAR